MATTIDQSSSVLVMHGWLFENRCPVTGNELSAIKRWDSINVIGVSWSETRTCSNNGPAVFRFISSFPYCIGRIKACIENHYCIWLAYMRASITRCTTVTTDHAVHVGLVSLESLYILPQTQQLVYTTAIVSFIGAAVNNWGVFICVVVIHTLAGNNAI